LGQWHDKGKILVSVKTEQTPSGISPRRIRLEECRDQEPPKKPQVVSTIVREGKGGLQVRGTGKSREKEARLFKGRGGGRTRLKRMTNYTPWEIKQEKNADPDIGVELNHNKNWTGPSRLAHKVRGNRERLAAASWMKRKDQVPMCLAMKEEGSLELSKGTIPEGKRSTKTYTVVLSGGGRSRDSCNSGQKKIRPPRRPPQGGPRTEVNSGGPLAVGDGGEQKKRDGYNKWGGGTSAQKSDRAYHAPKKKTATA